MLDVSDLHMVAVITETGSITRAAEQLHVSQPTLSKRLARLESQLNSKLFQRGPTGLTPTLIATYLVQSASKIKANIASIERQVSRLRDHQSGDLHVGCGPIIEQVLMPPVLTEFAMQTGKVRLYVVTDRAERLFEQLLAGKLDLIAGPYAPGLPEYGEYGLHSVPLVQEQTINVARRGHPIFTDQAEDFYAYPYAAPPRQGSMIGTIDPNAKPGARVFADNYNLLKSLVLGSDYICGGPRHIFLEELSRGELIEITPSPTATWQSAALMKAESLDTPLVDLFVNLLIAARDQYLAQNL